MLPSSPRPKGLPSNPRPRSRISKDDQTSPEYPRTDSSPALRPGRSREYSPALPHSDSRGIQLRGATPRSSQGSSKSLPSFDGRVELDAQRDDNKRRAPGATDSMAPLKETPSHEYISGSGDAIWNRVATVASSLTVSVSKAWSANIATSAGEETPPGQDSRLTRAMKAYHLAKARDPTDLPPWLFDERERLYSISHDVRHENDSRLCPQAADDITKTRGLRDIYDAYGSDTPISSQRMSKNDVLPQSSRATDRLKALRDAKRAAAKSATKYPSVEREQNPGEHEITPKVATQQQPRVGLPSGPRLG